MFIRVKTTPNSPRKSIQLVESTRKGGKVKQKIVRYIGIAMDDREEEKLKSLAQEVMAKMITEQINSSPQLQLIPATEDEILEGLKNKRGRKKRKRIEDILPVDKVMVKDIKEKERIVEGIHEVGNTIYKLLGYDSMLNKRDDNILRDLVLTRLAFPASKHKTQDILNKRFGKEYDLDALYRMMDKLYEHIDDIKQRTFNSMRSLFPNDIDLILFDVTTLSFETIEADELRQFGYSKDCRFNTTQVVLALATNSDGLPVGYELFEGNKAEVKTLIESIEHWRAIFNIGKVCFIGDRAMFSRNNLALLDAHGYNYIVAAKLRTLSKKVKEEILNENNYRPTVTRNSLIWINEIEHEGRRLIVNYKKSRAIKDSKAREQILNKLNKLIGKKGSISKFITNKGVKKFIRTDDESKAVIDDEYIAEDAMWDGLHGIITNIKEDRPESLLARYASLWVIEESFRINKHLLKIRPIFHWKPKRIHAHIAICYMTFAVLRHLQYRVSITQKISPEIIIEELMNVQSSIHIHKYTKDLYRLPGYLSNVARKIYKALNIERSLDATIYFP